ncbi:hypothetical protein [Novosphingobium beihaiensis]|uniref:Flagellar FliJ protein n=1 Tax=Novosphingobium beihaiensis TaxID=2930389 RepID=A0ABT0BVJ2_9SPHN|nr:hypothetical protein [Novosphingobium beihaiensis]MCJ2189095.1 hypothetical protein [Novosphingobium beihaiensis]
MSEAVDKLRVMLRVRGHQRDRLERAVIEERRENERCRAEHARRCDAVAKASDSHEAALFFRARNPADALVSDYLITQQSRLAETREAEEKAREEAARTAASLAETRASHHRAQVRFDALETEFDTARRADLRRAARKQERARQDGPQPGKIRI